MAEDLKLPITANRCPLCGGANGCTIAEGRDPKSCWCMSVTVPADLLEQLPAEAVGQRCICAACIEAWNSRGVLRRYAD